jgi:hypothetical protein
MRSFLSDREELYAIALTSASRETESPDVRI